MVKVDISLDFGTSRQRDLRQVMKRHREASREVHLISKTTIQDDSNVEDPAEGYHLD